ncbi:hypothetical protein OAF93_01840, partial [Planctomycetota bacterium]|nr:hypothetical protein [Planctomycetota bacterium]
RPTFLVAPARTRAAAPASPAATGLAVWRSLGRRLGRSLGIGIGPEVPEGKLPARGLAALAGRSLVVF